MLSNRHPVMCITSPLQLPTHCVGPSTQPGLTCVCGWDAQVRASGAAAGRGRTHAGAAARAIRDHGGEEQHGDDARCAGRAGILRFHLTESSPESACVVFVIVCVCERLGYDDSRQRWGDDAQWTFDNLKDESYLRRVVMPLEVFCPATHASVCLVEAVVLSKHRLVGSLSHSTLSHRCCSPTTSAAW